MMLGHQFFLLAPAACRTWRSDMLLNAKPPADLE